MRVMDPILHSIEIVPLLHYLLFENDLWWSVCSASSSKCSFEGGCGKRFHMQAYRQVRGYLVGVCILEVNGNAIPKSKRGTSCSAVLPIYCAQARSLYLCKNTIY